MKKIKIFVNDPNLLNKETTLTFPDPDNDVTVVNGWCEISEDIAKIYLNDGSGMFTLTDVPTPAPNDAATTATTDEIDYSSISIEDLKELATEAGIDPESYAKYKNEKAVRGFLTKQIKEALAAAGE